MKKLFAILLAVAVVCALSLTAFAADFTSLPQNTAASIDVSATFDEVDYEDAYFVTLTYTDIVFAYTAGVSTWNPSTLKWDAPEDAEWTTASATVNVVNKSSVGITVTFTDDIADDADVQLEYTSNGVLTLAEADVENDKTATGSAKEGTMTISVAEDSVIDEATDIGTITVSITETRAAE